MSSSKGSLSGLGKSFYIGVETASEIPDEAVEVSSIACSNSFFRNVKKATLREFFRELFYLWIKDNPSALLRQQLFTSQHQ